MGSTQEEQLRTLNQIRTLMEESSRFISLSGLSGVAAGVVALIGGFLARSYINTLPAGPQGGRYISQEAITHLMLLALGVLLTALILALAFTRMKARKAGRPLWDATARRLLVHLMIPLLAGGAFCLILVAQGTVGLVAPSMLIFYGLALISAGKYTLSEVRWLGGAELILGLLAALLPGYGLFFWMLGFGALHIVYGTVMYLRHER